MQYAASEHSVNQLTQVAPALLLGSGDQQRMRREAVGGHGVGDAGAAVVELFEYQAGVERVQPGATELLEDREVHQAQLPGLAHDVFGERLAFVVLRGDGNDLLGGEVAGRVLQLLLLGCELELHRARSASSTARPLPPA